MRRYISELEAAETLKRKTTREHERNSELFTRRHNVKTYQKATPTVGLRSFRDFSRRMRPIEALVGLSSRMNVYVSFSACVFMLKADKPACPGNFV